MSAGAKRLGRGVANTLSIAVLVVLVTGIYGVLGQQQTETCAVPVRSDKTTATQADGTVSPTVPEGALTSFTFGTDINSGPRSVPFTLSGPIAGEREVTVAPGPFADPTDGRQLPADQVRAWAIVDQAGTSGVVTICIPAASRQKGPWGTFTGSINFEDPRITSNPINVTVSGSYPDRQSVFLVWVVACLLASGYVFFLRDQPAKSGQLPDAAAEPALRWDFMFFRRYWTYMTAAVGVITVAAGLLAASAVYVSQYLKGTAWSASIGEWMAFCGAAAAAFVAGATAGRLAGNVYANPLNSDLPAGGGANPPPGNG